MVLIVLTLRVEMVVEYSGDDDGDGGSYANSSII